MSEEWIALNGCNSCINTSVCEKEGYCFLLRFEGLPNTKAKRRLIARIRTFGSGADEQIACYLKKISKCPTEVLTPPKLTVFDKAVIKSFKKFRKQKKNDHE